MPIKYDDYLKRPGQEFEYSLSHVEELDRCMNDITYYLKYVKIIHPDHGRIKFQPREFQKTILETIKNHNQVCCLISRQSGKALDIKTPIYKSNGELVEIGNIKVGDFIFGTNGKKTKVTYTTDVMHNHKCYEIEFDNGEVIIADEDHIWSVEIYKKIKNLTTKEIYSFIQKHGKGPSVSIPISEPLIFKERKLPIDPYILGLWLGDGHSANGRISISKTDFKELSDIVNEKYNISELKIDKRTNNSGYFNIYGFISDLKKYQLLHNKHIPKDYIFTSIDQRLELLRGLMDTDGYCNKKGNCQFYQKNISFIKDVRFLLTSLGIKSRLKGKLLNGETYYTLTFTTTKYSVFNLKRKIERQKKCLNHSKNNKIYFSKIKETQSVPVKCIQVDSSDHLFLCGRTMVPTHNTTIISIYALWFAIFNPDKFIGIVSNKQSSAVDILGRIKTMYEELPLWLKPGVVEWSKLSVKFDNGTQIVVSATSADAFRGRTLNLLFCDEIAFVRKGIAEDFWAANFPTMSASEEAKIVIISCVAGNTYVFTDKGPKQIVDFDNNKLGPKTVYPYNVVGKNKINSGNLFVNSGIAKTKIIETTSSKLEGSLNHKLWGCKNGKYNWYKLSELSIGDFISIQYGMDIWGNNDNISFEFNSMKYNKKNKIIDRKLQKDKQLKIDKITSDWAYLFGLYISEGYSDKYRLCISCGDDISWIFKKLNIKYSCFDNMHYNIESIAIVELLKFVGFDITRKAPQKIIPKRLLEMSRENIIALLQGIFDGDGWSRKDNGKIGIGLSSKELIDQIRMLLLNFGILTEYQEVFTTIESSKGKVKSNTTQYRIYTSVNGSKKFYKTIGFKLERKQNKNIALPVKDNVCKTDIIPYANIYLKKYSKVLRDTIIINRKKNIEHLSKNFVIKIFDVLKEKNIPVDDDLQLIYDSSISENIKWEKIKSIEDSENIVYDFSLPDIKNDNWCHSVLYNGYIGHQTPNGPFNLFHRLYTQAERGENTFIPLKYNWKCVPERDEKWATDQRKNLGKLKFEQEHEVDFIGSINTIVDKDVLEKLYFGVKEPITREMTGKLLIYEKPIEGSRYVIGADTAKGTGEHHSALQVCKIISTSPAEFQQVATFFDNRINVFKFADLINKLSIYYNDAFMMVENNAEGSAVVNRLWWDYENEGLVNSGSKESQLGIRATKNTRPRAVTLMKKLVEDEKVHIVDKETVDELTSFIEENGKFKGKDMPDDIISALYWCLFIVEMDVFEEKATLTRDTHDAEEWEEVWGIITDGDPENNFDWLISESKLID